MKLKFFLPVLVLFSTSLFAQDTSSFWRHLVPVEVLAVHDGDNLTVAVFKDTMQGIIPAKVPVWKRTVRLAGLDAPEVVSSTILKTQPYGLESGAYLRKLTLNRTVWLDTLSVAQVDPYTGVGGKRRLLADVYLKDSTFLNLQIVETGNAWAYPGKRENKKVNSLLKDAEAEARHEKRGLFGTGKRAVRPTTWKEKYRRQA